MASIVSDQWSSEDSRERAGEAERVIGWMGIRPDLTVADIGAGAGYYTVRLAQAVGPNGRVLAQDVMPDYVARLRRRVAAMPNVSVGLGEPGDPRLPPAERGKNAWVRTAAERAAILGKRLRDAATTAGGPGASAGTVTMFASFIGDFEIRSTGVDNSPSEFVLSTSVGDPDTVCSSNIDAFFNPHVVTVTCAQNSAFVDSKFAVSVMGP